MEILSEEEDQFFDTRDDCPSVSDSGSESPDNLDSDFGAIGSLPGSIGYEVWIKNPGCIRERRIKFLKWMGLDVDHAGKGDPGYTSSNEVEVETDRIMEHSDAVLRSCSLDDGPSSSQSSMSSWSNDAQELLDGAMEENFVCRIGNLDNGTEFIPDELRLDDRSGRVREVGSNRLLNVAEIERSLGSSHLAQQVMRREVEHVPNLGLARKQVKMGWLRRLGAVACIVDRQVESGGDCSYPVSGARNQIVRVKSYQKRSKEFSALYMRQDIPAHEGSILTMKFSPDGQYLASAGEDGVVRVWQVMEKERSDEFGTLDIHSSPAHFTINGLSVAPLKVDTEKKGQFKSMRTSDSACVIFPQRVFQISDKPIHEFFGHCGDVLDLSWSKDKYLLSSSVDKTVRMWKVGCDKCQQVFFHNDYVTCVQFNPVDENYFISGSIDGKVRIWAIPGCQVVDWTDITEIVTAVCYCPDGKGGIVGSMNGICRFYDASDNRLQQNAQICLKGKKSPSKRITGFQFSPSEPTRLMVTSADNQVRILHGVDVICKYRGLRNAGSQISASFTSDGIHIVSASEDSNVYIWNSVSQNGPVDQVKSKWSCEHFFSNSVSVAIPWCGMTSMNCSSSNVTGKSPSSTNSELCSEKIELLQSELVESSKWKLPFSSTENLSLSHGFFPHSLPKGSATWPAENLPGSSLVVSSALCKSQYKFLKMSCQSMHGSPHAWGLVIVTAGWDGRIRSFQNYGLPFQ